MRALAIADLHLGQGADLGREPGERLAEQEQVWARALKVSRDLRADLILFAGDAFHKARPTPEEMLAFERPLMGHRGAGGAPLVAVVGNHDVASANIGTGLEVFHEAGLLRLYRDPGFRPATPTTVAVACLPWTSVGRLVAAAGGGDRDEINRQAGEALLQIARGLRARITGPAILMTHFSVSGAVTPTGREVGLDFGTVIDAAALEAVGFEAVVVGHIHKPQPIFPAGETGVTGFYTGSPMPLDFGEAATEHGAWIVDIDEDGVQTFFVPLDSRRLVTHDLNLVTDQGIFDLARLPDVRDAVVKIRIAATREQAARLDVGQIKRDVVALGAHKVWTVQLDVRREERARVDKIDETIDELAALDLYMAARGINGARGARLRDLTERYLEATR